MVLVITKKTSEAQKSCTLSMRLHTLMEFIKFILQFLRRLNSLCGSRGQNKDQVAEPSRRQAGFKGKKQILMVRAGQHGVSPRRPEGRPAGSKPTWPLWGTVKSEGPGHPRAHLPDPTSQGLGRVSGLFCEMVM